MILDRYSSYANQVSSGGNNVRSVSTEVILLELKNVVDIIDSVSKMVDDIEDVDQRREFKEMIHKIQGQREILVGVFKDIDNSEGAIHGSEVMILKKY